MSIRVRSDLPADSHGKVVATLLAAVEMLTEVPCDAYADTILASGGEDTVGLTSINCRHCDAAHDPRYLCDPAKAVLDALEARAAERHMPTLEFIDAPLADNPFKIGSNPGDALMLQLVVQAAAVPLGDTGLVRPGVILTGVGHDGQPLPQWLYVGRSVELRQASRLFSDMAELAIRSARKEST